MSKKKLFDNSDPNAVSYHAVTDINSEHNERMNKHQHHTPHGNHRNINNNNNNNNTQQKLGRRSSRFDAVFIAPKRKEQGPTKSFRNKRESVVYAGTTARKPHIADPYHALHQVPTDRTLQHQLSSAANRKPIDRLLMYADYWATIHLDMQYYNLSPVDIISLPSAPIPTFHNDGKPHILKYSSTGASKRINATHVHKHYDAQHMSAVEKLKLKDAQLKHQKMMKSRGKY